MRHVTEVPSAMTSCICKWIESLSRMSKSYYGNILEALDEARCKYDSTTNTLIQLHWLPISFRIKFKILTLVYSCFDNAAPKYLWEMLVPYKTRGAYNGAMLEDYLRYRELTNVHLLTDPLVCVDHDYGMNCQKCCMLHQTSKLLKRNSKHTCSGRHTNCNLLF